MFCKLALKNVRKSFKDYLIYFLTLAFSVCLFYSFNSFQAQQAVMEMSSAQADIIVLVQDLMGMLSVFVAIVLGFLIIYANNFLIKRRKQELGLYMLLGMPKRQISRVLVYETMLVGLISLVMGIVFGLLVSQLLTVVTANLFEAKLNYQFVFSMDATITTIVAFAVIFFIVMVFNTLLLNRYKLIDLLSASKKNETLKIKHMFVSILIFITALAVLGYTYHFALSEGINALMRLDIIAPLGILGTVLFFLSLAGFLLRFVQSSPSIYFRKLNLFVLRQINASINSNFVSMSVVCILLLFSIGALATGTNLNRTLNHTLQLATPYDFTLTTYHDAMESDSPSIREIRKELDIPSDQIESEHFITTYRSKESLSDFLAHCQTDTTDTLVEQILDMQSDLPQGMPFEVLSLSDFNQLRKTQGLAEISLAENEGYLFTSGDILSQFIDSILDQHPTIEVYGHSIHIGNDTFDLLNTGTTYNTSTVMFAVVVNDDLIPEDALLYDVSWNVMLEDGIDQPAFSAMVEEQWMKYHEQRSLEVEDSSYMYRSASAQEVKENSKGLSVVMTYIGLYLGLVFLMASALILALQQLSQAIDNKQRYQILNKIGAEGKMLAHSLLLQLSIYFFMPLLLAVVHSIVGIQVVNMIVLAFGKGDIFMASLITGSMILVIYGIYFLITYLGCKNIIAKS